MPLIFQYDIEFPPLANPPGRKAQFDESLRCFLESGGYDYAMSAMGGVARTYGYVGRTQNDVLPNDRTVLRGWLEEQPIKCIVRFGHFEPNTHEIDLLGEITDLVFHIDNLTESDRSLAAANAENIRKLVQQRAKRTDNDR